MGGSDSKAAEPPKAPSLQQASSTLGAKIDDLEAKIAKADEEARQWISKQGANPTAKSRAMQAIKRKKLYETQRDQLLGTQFNVETLAFQQEQAGVSLAAVQAMQQATAQLKQKTDRIGVEQVDKLRDDMADLAADMQDIQAALAQPSAGAAEDDAERELEALYAQQAQEEEEEAARILMGGGALPSAPSSAAAAAQPCAAPARPHGAALRA